jgi:hypothetical protein
LIRRIGGPTNANFSPIRSAVTSRQLSGNGSPLNNFGGSGGLTSFSSGFGIGATPFKSDIWAAHCDSQPHNAAATISARQQIASAIHIVVTFNFRFAAHNGLKSDIALCPKWADFVAKVG